MFAVYCKGHGSHVLLSNDHIVEVTNHEHGIDVRWRCDRSHEGVWHVAHARRPRLHVAA